MKQNEEHIVQVPVAKMAEIRKWMENPNGALRIDSRLVLEAVEGGGILIRTQPFRSPPRP